MTYFDILSSSDEGQFSSKTVREKIIELWYMAFELQYFEQHSVKILHSENKFGPQRVKLSAG